MTSLAKLYTSIAEQLDVIAEAERRLKRILESTPWAGTRKFKGNEITGWLGELAVAAHLNGRVIEREDVTYDVVTTRPNRRISVKARRRLSGSASWRTSSLISEPKSEEKKPTHLAFVVLDENYRVERIHLFPWKILTESELKTKSVRGKRRGLNFYLRSDRENIKKYVLYNSRIK